ncbi:DEAD/DEAH box helicase family protein [Epilithonimonas ginsengisoli]|uniref:DEAD/DEAH box helicase family protein n=1 Tax=Epilithonimonas ginsengisoli TaxID=1245592 RepID=A0ABU4JMG1_9FLAO|nr:MULTISPECIES: type I restriction endonuclease subunit R [Chryseobacterium group]MBV6878893.1 DEAD/DEAH box helicase family protein [Epilithonimonas sp. FP105]MDW8550855.1 DEAD/DEAH box helicase family protein [Epilithonimonas ginsengisoli]OAH71833.1 restriction endonuclease subunit R [Chryseobacterium sp. FP211-J200]
MNEADTRAELIDPQLKACGWGVVEDSRILREYNITAGKIQSGGVRAKKLTADYVLVYKGIKLAVVEAKSDDLEVGEGVAQAKQYAEKLKLETTYSTNGKEIYSICMKTGAEGLVVQYLTPEQLWDKTFAVQNEWREKFASVPFEDKSGTWQPRFYQELAVNKELEAVANKQQRILLTLATGTGKTAIAFQIAWKLFQTRWNLSALGSDYMARRPRILFLADRNILANQAFNAFSAFPDDALVRISPKEISKAGRVPTNGSIFFTIFQTFMTNSKTPKKVEEEKPVSMVAEPPQQYGTEQFNFGQYPKDYFDLIVIDECHRGGANDEGNWRGILEYFSPAVQLGLTATPKRKDNVDTYKYFGEPVFVYSLKEGINDGFLTPFKVKRIQTTLDDYIYTSDDQIIEGEVEEGKNYVEADFNKIIEIKEREAKRVQIYLDNANQKEKAIIFCATQDHAAAVRDLVNQYKTSTNPNYCVRVTANDGEIGEQFLREFQDNEKTIPTILTTSQKLSTGVDARNIRNIVLMRPVNSMIEFKQIVGRGTRLFDGKDFFTIYDFVNAYNHFSDPEWDGDALPCEECGQLVCECETVIKPQPTPCKECNETPCVCDKPEREPCSICGEISCSCNKRQKIKIKLRDGKEREIQSMIATSFWGADGKPISAEEFMNNLFGELPNLFQSEEELRKLWSSPLTRRTLLEKLSDAGFGKDDLSTLQKLIDAEKSDLFDVLEYVFNSDIKPMTREARVAAAQATIFALLNDKQKEFIEFVLSKYIETGVDELDQEKLPVLLLNKYQSLEDAKDILGEVGNISKLFIEFQQHLYAAKIA